jgi:hypothetical protein
VPSKPDLLRVLDRIATTTETSSEIKKAPHSKRRTYVVQNTRFDAVLDKSDIM